MHCCGGPALLCFKSFLNPSPSTTLVRTRANRGAKARTSGPGPRKGTWGTVPHKQAGARAAHLRPCRAPPAAPPRPCTPALRWGRPGPRAPPAGAPGPALPGLHCRPPSAPRRPLCGGLCTMPAGSRAVKDETHVDLEETGGAPALWRSPLDGCCVLRRRSGPSARAAATLLSVGGGRRHPAKLGLLAGACHQQWPRPPPCSWTLGHLRGHGRCQSGLSPACSPCGLSTRRLPGAKAERFTPPHNMRWPDWVCCTGPSRLWFFPGSRFA